VVGGGLGGHTGPLVLVTRSGALLVLFVALGFFFFGGVFLLRRLLHCGLFLRGFFRVLFLLVGLLGLFLGLLLEGFLGDLGDRAVTLVLGLLEGMRSTFGTVPVPPLGDVVLDVVEMAGTTADHVGL